MTSSLPDTIPPPAEPAEDDESLRAQLSALRELVEGYRESHRALFSQIKALRMQRDEAEQQFWSLVARSEARPGAEAPVSDGDPFGELQLEELPPPTRRRSTQEVRSSEIIAHMQAEIRSLNQEISDLTETNKELLDQLDEAQKNSQPMPSLAGGATQEEIENLRAAMSRKNTELVRLADQNRRLALDLEISRAQTEEEVQEKAALQQRLSEAHQLVRQLRSRPAGPDLRESLFELQRLVAGLALGLGRASYRESHSLTAARRGLMVARTSPGISGMELELITHEIFPSDQRPAEPDLGEFAAACDPHDLDPTALGSSPPPVVAAVAPAPASGLRPTSEPPSMPRSSGPATRKPSSQPVASASGMAPMRTPSASGMAPMRAPSVPAMAPMKAPSVPAMAPMKPPSSVPPSTTSSPPDALENDPFADPDPFDDPPLPVISSNSRNSAPSWASSQQAPGSAPGSGNPSRQRTVLGYDPPPDPPSDPKKASIKHPVAVIRPRKT